jgi:hypothetical protein
MVSQESSISMRVITDDILPAVPSKSAPTAAGHEPVGQHLKAIIAAISRLEALGLQKLNIPLPKCIIVGESFLSSFSLLAY